jgi:hypothetical protein
MENAALDFADRNVLVAGRSSYVGRIGKHFYSTPTQVFFSALRDEQLIL